jgi:electron transfer flavoprotein alpha subunit
MQTFIYIEPSEEGVDTLTKQIASRIGKIAEEFRGPLKGISIGRYLDGKESHLSGLIDELIVVEVPSGSESNTEVISKILTDIIAENSPGVLFLGFTHQGMELGPAVGWRLGIPVITSCVAFEWNGGGAYIKRPILGGKLVVSLSVNLERGGVISVQKGAWKDEVVSEGKGEAISVSRLAWRDSWAAEKTEIINISEEILEGEEDITKAEILVSVGRGLGDPENLPLFKELAGKLGGVISCSRPVVDLGWLPASRQVGISGKTVAPVIYLALGISGQSNHVAGMDASGIIIAVNKDPLAPIFNVAHYGIVDNILEFVPELIKQIENKEDS